MTAKQVEKILSNEDNYNLLMEEIECPGSGIKLDGYLFKYVDNSRPPNDLETEQLIFSVDGETFAIEGYYNSWDSTEYDASQVKKVKKTTIEMTIWK